MAKRRRPPKVIETTDGVIEHHQAFTITKTADGREFVDTGFFVRERAPTDLPEDQLLKLRAARREQAKGQAKTPPEPPSVQLEKLRQEMKAKCDAATVQAAEAVDDTTGAKSSKRQFDAAREEGVSEAFLVLGLIGWRFPEGEEVSEEAARLFLDGIAVGRYLERMRYLPFERAALTGKRKNVKAAQDAKAANDREEHQKWIDFAMKEIQDNAPSNPHLDWKWLYRRTAKQFGRGYYTVRDVLQPLVE